MSTPTSTHRLTVLSPGTLRGTTVDVSRGPFLVGRAAACDLRLDDPCVSGTHAVLHPVKGPLDRVVRVVVEDLHSRNGTRVNDGPVTTARPLSHGDVIRFGTVEARYEQGAAAHNASLQTVTALPSAGFAAYDRRGRGRLSTRTGARRLIALSLILHLAAIAMAVVFTRRVVDLVKAAHRPVNFHEVTQRLMTPEWRGLPVAVIGGLVAVTACSLTIAGIVLHLVAASRRRCIGEQLERVDPSHCRDAPSARRNKE
ncbi:FHA domain-containing protein [Streptomyces sp. NPDC102467]|uniref:FHA domain-containing protein n=1 Tax=Streptomyces sp. NPDC102467 TaxID=3366179 RepID=UPI0037F5BE53